MRPRSLVHSDLILITGLALGSHKNVLYHHRYARQTDVDISTWWSTAEGRWKLGHHPSPLGHQLIADLILSYILETTCLDNVQTRHIDRNVPGPMDISYFDNPNVSLLAASSRKAEHSLISFDSGCHGKSITSWDHRQETSL